MTGMLTRELRLVAGVKLVAWPAEAPSAVGGMEPTVLPAERAPSEPIGIVRAIGRSWFRLSAGYKNSGGGGGA